MIDDTQLDTLRGTILAVDDSPTIRKLVSMTMEGQGYRVVVASDGIEALAILKDEHPDLILCDVAMPKLDGYQLCKIIKQSTDTKHIPVVMLSGKDGLFDKVRGKMAGCSNYITKPFEPDILISEVRKYVKPALIPMTPYKPKKKTPEVARPNQTIENPDDVAHKDTPDDNERLLADQLADLALPGDQTTPVGIQNAPAWTTPQSPEPVSVRADDLPPLPEKPQSEPKPDLKPDPPPQTPDAKPTEQVTLSEAAGAGTAALDKLLSELDQDEDIVTPTRPGEPFRSRCPGCRTVFRNVRPDDYDKHARCKKCSTRFHLGDHLVV
jgi:twitching motility two-component system response regulator PilG